MPLRTAQAADEVLITSGFCVGSALARYRARASH